MKPSGVHKSELHAGIFSRHYPNGMVDWNPEKAPNLHAAYPHARTTGRLRGCAYCGSMHPTDLAAALLAGATLSFADWKYGWPHKAYVEKIPNPHVGMLESRMMASHATPWCPDKGAPCVHGNQSSRRAPADCCMAKYPERVMTGSTGEGYPVVLKQDGFDSNDGKPTYQWRCAGKPAAAVTDGKFYSKHLIDATPEERVVIERAMGLNFEFRPDGRVTWRKFGDPRPASWPELVPEPTEL